MNSGQWDRWGWRWSVGGDSPSSLLFWVTQKPCKGDKSGTVAVDCWGANVLSSHHLPTGHNRWWSVGDSSAVLPGWEVQVPWQLRGRSPSAASRMLCAGGLPSYPSMLLWCSGNSKTKFLKFEKIQFALPQETRQLMSSNQYTVTAIFRQIIF